MSNLRDFWQGYRKMKKFWLFVSGMVTGALLVAVSYQYHFVQSKDGFVVVSKPQATLSDIFADIRQWELKDWQEHPQLLRALVADGRGELVGGSIVENALDRLLPSSSSPEPQSASDILDSLHR